MRSRVGGKDSAVSDEPTDGEPEEPDRDEIIEGIEELLEPPPPEGGPADDADAPPPG
jgi:hypothetical protein